MINRGATAPTATRASTASDADVDAIQRPAYTLVLYGTNDWHDQTCQDAPPPAAWWTTCEVMVEAVKATGSLPVVATCRPVNPTLNPAQRNEWIRG